MAATMMPAWMPMISVSMRPLSPAAVQQTVVNGQGGLTVTGTDGDDPVAFGNTGERYHRRVWR